jgi:hypothetical protein
MTDNNVTATLPARLVGLWELKRAEDLRLGDQLATTDIYGNGVIETVTRLEQCGDDVVVNEVLTTSIGNLFLATRQTWGASMEPPRPAPAAGESDTRRLHDSHRQTLSEVWAAYDGNHHDAF